MAFADSVFGIIDGSTGFESANDAEERLRKLAISPEFYGGDYEQQSYAGDLNPVLYDTPEAAQYQTISEDPRTRDMQMQALQRMQGFADQAANGAESLGRYNAISDANALAAQREAAVRNQMAMRGQGGSGLEFVLAQQAGQQAAGRAQAGALNAAQQAALQRLAGTQATMAGASGLRGQDADIQGRNAAIINAFNMANTNARNAAAQGNVNMKNSAAGRNLDARQGVSNAGTDMRNASINRRDRLAQTRHGNEMERFGMENQINAARTQGLATAVKGGVGAGMDLIQAGMAGYGGKKKDEDE